MNTILDASASERRKGSTLTREELDTINVLRLLEFEDTDDCSRLSKASLCGKTSGRCQWSKLLGRCLRRLNDCKKASSKEECNDHPDVCKWVPIGPHFGCQPLKPKSNTRHDVRAFLLSFIDFTNPSNFPVSSAMGEVGVMFFKPNLESEHGGDVDNAPNSPVISPISLVFTIYFTSLRETSAVRLYSGHTGEAMTTNWEGVNDWCDENASVLVPVPPVTIDLPTSRTMSMTLFHVHMRPYHS